MMCHRPLSRLTASEPPLRCFDPPTTEERLSATPGEEQSPALSSASSLSRAWWLKLRAGLGLRASAGDGTGSLPNLRRLPAELTDRMADLRRGERASTTIRRLGLRSHSLRGCCG